MTAQIPAVAPTTIIPAAIAAFVGTSSASTISKGSIWKDGSYYVTITNVDGDLVEYGYPHSRDVFYLSSSNFRRQFEVVPKGHTFNAKEKAVLMTELKKCLLEVKEKGLGDHVYFMMDEFGL